jgi:hypothetical protein
MKPIFPPFSMRLWHCVRFSKSAAVSSDEMTAYSAFLQRSKKNVLDHLFLFPEIKEYFYF